MLEPVETVIGKLRMRNNIIRNLNSNGAIDASIVIDVILWYILFRSCRNVTMGWSQDPGPPNGG